MNTGGVGGSGALQQDSFLAKLTAHDALEKARKANFGGGDLASKLAVKTALEDAVRGYPAGEDESPRLLGDSSLGGGLGSDKRPFPGGGGRPPFPG